MPVLQALDREGIRLAALYNARAVFEGSSTSASAGVSDIIDRKLRGGTDDHVGKWLMVVSGARDGDISQVSAYNASTFTLTVRPDLGGTLANGVDYLLIDEPYRPQFVHNCINQAIHHITSKAYDPEEDVSLHLNGFERRYVIPSVFDAIGKLERRAQYSGSIIDPCETGWTQQTNITQAFDSTQRREGGNSLRLVLAAAVAAGDNVASKTITSLDISKTDRIEMWIRSTVATASGDFTLRLTSGSTTVAFNIPALVANTWTYVRMTLNPDDARLLTAVVTVVIRQVVDIGAATLWIDDIKAVENSSAQWEEIRGHLWDIDKEATEIVFRPAYGTVPYGLLKISGSGRPVLLNADATVSEVDPTYMIAMTTNLILRANPEADPRLTAEWRQEAERRIRDMTPFANKRDVT